MVCFLFPFYDIHTHNHISEKDVLAIKNIASHFTGTIEICSMGLHPWDLQDTAILWDELVNATRLNNVKAIGECGLDKLCKTDWDLQLHYFKQQVLLANQVRKPIIIHCVRAYNEVLDILAEHATVPAIFHGYNRNEQLAKQIILHGYYLSFGAPILNERSTAAMVLKQIPATNFFLETDDATNTDIKLLYNAAAQIREQSLEHVQEQIELNFTKTFHQ